MLTVAGGLGRVVTVEDAVPVHRVEEAKLVAGTVDEGGLAVETALKESGVRPPRPGGRQAELVAEFQPGHAEGILVAVEVAISRSPDILVVGVEPGRQPQGMPVPSLVDQELAGLERDRPVGRLDTEPFELTFLKGVDVGPEAGADAAKLRMVEELLGVIGRVAIGIEADDFTVRCEGSGEGLEHPAMIDVDAADGDAGLVAPEGIGIDPPDTVRPQCLLHPWVELAAIAEVPHLDGELAAGVPEDANRDIDRREETPATSADDDAAFGLPNGRWRRWSSGGLVEQVAERLADILPPVPTYRPQPRRMAKKIFDSCNGSVGSQCGVGNRSRVVRFVVGAGGARRQSSLVRPPRAALVNLAIADMPQFGSVSGAGLAKFQDGSFVYARYPNQRQRTLPQLGNAMCLTPVPGFALDW